MSSWSLAPRERRGHLGQLGLLHLRAAEGGLAGTAAARAEVEPPLHDVADGEEGSACPEQELEGAEGNVGTGRSAHAAAAEEQLADEDGEGNETGEVEESVGQFDGQHGHRVSN
jgi:hypothetical protein